MSTQHLQALIKAHVSSGDIVELLTETKGEITPEVEALLTLDLQVKENVDHSHALIERLDHEAEFYRDQANALVKIAQALEASSERVRGSLKKIMIETGLTELNGETRRFVLARTKDTLVVCKEQLPEKYMKQKITIVPDNDKIRAELEGGMPVEGAELHPSFSLRPYLRKKGTTK